MAHPDSTSRPLTRRRKLVYTVVVFGVFLAISEFLAWGALSFFRQGLMPVHEELESVASSARHTADSNETIHPYLGWVMNPELHPGTDLFEHSVPVNSLGLNDIEHGVVQRNAGELIIGVAGGSVAWQMSVAGEGALREVLTQRGLLNEKKLRIVRIAMSGYKQPQQLMALNYLLSLGMEFDAVVNIDGYNEVALTACDNIDAGVFPAYPRMWQARMQDVVDPRVYSVSFQLLRLRAERQQLAQERLASPLAGSRLLDLIWCLRDRRLVNRIAQLGQDLVQKKIEHGLGFAALGPGSQRVGDEYNYAEIIELWKNCSLQMHHVCEGNGIIYLHVLQPNQYLPESKPWTPLERDELIVRNQCYGQCVARCYPSMIEQGEQLKADGVRFLDFTRLFATTTEQVYQDPFCHFNELGNRLLAEAVAESLVEHLKDPDSTEPVRSAR